MDCRYDIREMVDLYKAMRIWKTDINDLAKFCDPKQEFNGDIVFLHDPSYEQAEKIRSILNSKHAEIEEVWLMKEGKDALRNKFFVIEIQERTKYKRILRISHFTIRYGPGQEDFIFSDLSHGYSGAGPCDMLDILKEHYLPEDLLTDIKDYYSAESGKGHAIVHYYKKNGSWKKSYSI